VRNKEKLLVFGCEQSYFFRAGQPFNAGEYGYLPSLFPPTVQVMQGVIRTALLKGHGVDFNDYKNNYCGVCRGDSRVCKVLQAVGRFGSNEKIGMDLKGPCVVRWNENEQERLYPIPRDLVKTESKSVAEEYICLQPDSQPQITDRGNIHLPAAKRRYKILEQAWISETGLESYLTGKKIRSKDIYWAGGNSKAPGNMFLSKEQRFGIAFDHIKRSAKEQMLYSTEHIRLRPGYGLAVRVGRLPELSLPDMVKLGGEGRISSLQAYVTEPISKTGIVAASRSGTWALGGDGF